MSDPLENIARQRILKLGSRQSPLAVAQSRLIKAALEADHPTVAVEIIEFVTRGDKDQQTPLTDVKDPNFFNAELDTALLNGDIDFCVHSLKDLPLVRPEGISIAAIPERENPRDAVLFRADVVEKIRRGEPLRIGTSSARRGAGIQRFLPMALPHDSNTAIIEPQAIRGPVDQRLLRLQDNAEDALDGVVLAMAGLNRLFNDGDGRAIIEPLLKNLRWMVLPISEFPCAPGQAALAIECRHDDAETRLLLGSLLDEETAKIVMTERALLADLSEEQRARYSATAIPHPLLNVLLWINPGDQGGAYADTELHWLAPVPPGKCKAFDESLPEGFRQRRTLPVPADLSNKPAVFIAHHRALPESGQPKLPKRIWTSGIMSWQKLAARGIWIEGCAENLSFESIKPELATAVLQLPPLKKWIALTHADAESSWEDSGIGHVVSTYRIETAELRPIALEDTLRACSHFYWNSFNEYLAMEAMVPDHAHHACGAGKTLRQLQEYGVWTVDVFPSRKHWQKWINS